MDTLKSCLQGGQTKEYALNHIQKVFRGYEKVTLQMLRSWRTLANETGKPSKKRTGGPIKNGGAGISFDIEVIKKLICYSVDNDNETGTIHANVAYTSRTIQKAAEETRKEASWEKYPKLQKLEFSPRWIQRFLKDMQLSRLRVTSKVKNKLPTEQEVRSIMRGIQKIIDDNC